MNFVRSYFKELDQYNSKELFPNANIARMMARNFLKDYPDQLNQLKKTRHTICLDPDECLKAFLHDMNIKTVGELAFSLSILQPFQTMNEFNEWRNGELAECLSENTEQTVWSCRGFKVTVYK